MRQPTVNQPPPLHAKEETLPELEELEATTSEKNRGARGTYSGGSTPGPKNDGAAATQIYTKACARKGAGRNGGVAGLTMVASSRWEAAPRRCLLLLLLLLRLPLRRRRRDNESED